MFLIFAMVFEDNIVIVESVNSVDDKLACDANIDPITNNLNLGNVHLQCDKNLFKDDELHILAIEFKFKSGRHTIEI